MDGFEKQAAMLTVVGQQYMQLSSTERRILSSTIEEHMGHTTTYPVHIQNLLLSKHLAFAGRFSLTLFVLQNGLPPTLYVEWLIGRGMLRDWEARTHIANILTANMTGKLEETNKTAYKMHATAADGEALPVSERVQVVLTPSFARMWQHKHYWTAATAALLDPLVTTASIYAEWRKQAAPSKLAKSH